MDHLTAVRINLYPHIVLSMNQAVRHKRKAWQLAILLTTINGLITMAPNLALSNHDLIQNMISSKLQVDKDLKMTI